MPTQGNRIDASFIIVNWNTKDLLLKCIESVFSTVQGLTFEIVVVDNGSSDGSVAAVRIHYPEIRCIENTYNHGFAKANNNALRMIRGRYALLLNTDVVLKQYTVGTVIDFMDRTPGAGICGGQLLNEDGSKQNSIANTPSLATELTNKSLLRFFFPKRFPGKEHDTITSPVEVESVIGSFMAVRKEAIDDVGLFDEDYFFFLEETDWCLRFRKRGWKVFFHPDAEIIHLQGMSAGKAFIRARIEYWASRYLFFRKNDRMAVCVALRTGLMLKLIADFFLSLMCNILTLFTNQKAKLRLKLYATLIAWHAAGCPASWGLRDSP